MNQRLRAIDKNITDCHDMIAKLYSQVEGFQGMQPSRSMSQKKIDKRIARFRKEAKQWEARLAKWEAQRVSETENGQ